jgi:hypothetical protein
MVGQSSFFLEREKKRLSKDLAEARRKFCSQFDCFLSSVLLMLA